MLQHSEVYRDLAQLPPVKKIPIFDDWVRKVKKTVSSSRISLGLSSFVGSHPKVFRGTQKLESIHSFVSSALRVMSSKNASQGPE